MKSEECAAVGRIFCIKWVKQQHIAFKAKALPELGLCVEFLVSCIYSLLCGLELPQSKSRPVIVGNAGESLTGTGHPRGECCLCVPAEELCHRHHIE